MRERTLLISRNDQSPVVFAGIATASPALSLDGVPDDGAEEETLILTVALDGAALEPGEFTSNVTLTTRHGKWPDLTVPVRAFVRQPHGFVSSVFAKLRPGQSQELPLLDGAGQDLTIENVTFEGDERIAVVWPAGGEGTEKRLIRMTRTDAPGEGRLAKGRIVASVSGRERPASIPVVAFLLEE